MRNAGSPTSAVLLSIYLQDGCCDLPHVMVAYVSDCALLRAPFVKTYNEGLVQGCDDPVNCEVRCTVAYI